MRGLRFVVLGLISLRYDFPGSLTASAYEGGASVYEDGPGPAEGPAGLVNPPTVLLLEKTQR